jgi:hypothetical protein
LIRSEDAAGGCVGVGAAANEGRSASASNREKIRVSGTIISVLERFRTAIAFQRIGSHVKHQAAAI